MYEHVLAAGTTVAATATTAAVLPNTGVGSSVVTIAVAVLVGMVTWGVTYSRVNR